MIKRLAFLVTLCYLLVPAGVAAAHPLGNFTINRFARVEVAGDTLYVRYVVDMAEIPTLQGVKPRFDGLSIRVDGRPAKLRVVRTSLAHPRAAAGLRTTRFEAILAGPRVDGRARVDIADRTYAGRIGWKEIVVGAHTRSTSDELRGYPNDLLRSPLDVTHLTAHVEPTDDAAPTLLRTAAAPHATAGFASLVGREHLSALVVLASLAAALFWGAAHALSPGHGKTIVTAYLVGSRGTPAHAALLGLITTVTHTIGVFALGGITLALSQWIVPDHLYPWIDLGAGLLVVGVGASVFVGRARHARAHRHGDEHQHHDDHGHHHRRRRGLVAVGISGGLLPCPSALVVLLGAISLHRVGFGMLLVLAFSLGLAFAITAVGLVAVLAKRAFARFDGNGRLIAVLPALSAAVILVAGVAMTARALPKVTL